MNDRRRDGGRGGGGQAGSGLPPRGGQPPRSGGYQQQGPDRHYDGGALRYPIPAAAARAWQVHRGRPGQNPALVFDRFSPRWDDEARGSEKEGEVKKLGLQAVIQAAKQADPALLTGWQRRWEMDATFVHAKPLTLRSDWRLITGLREKGPLEVGFTFHRYGFPYLPGSGLKGLARSAALFELADQLGEAGIAAAEAWWQATAAQRSPKGLAALAALLELDHDGRFVEGWAALGAEGEAARGIAERFRAVFGTTNRAGRALFLDAIPDTLPKLDLDIMNPHVPDYYKEGLTGQTPPTSWQSPIPVTFLTVAPRTPFRFAVGWRGGPPAAEDRLVAEQAHRWLIAGLTEQGAGGKTGAGYGYFQPPPADAAPAHPAPAATGVVQSQAAAAPAPPVPVDQPALTWQRGTVAEYQPGPGRGRLRDDATGTEYRFTRDTIVDKGWSPGKKNPVQYVLEERDGSVVVVRVRKPVR